jgi:4-aminobutyrate aminotransferase
MLKESYLSNNTIVEEEKKVVAKTQKLPYYPLAFQKGKGALLYDYEGNEYIDFLSSASSANIGHGNKEIAQAVKNQMENLSQYIMSYFYSNEASMLAKKLINLTPGNNDKKVMFSSSGSAAIDGAIKAARVFTGRPKIISFYESFHGNTYGAVSISAISVNMRKKLGPLLPEVYHFNYPNCKRCKHGKDVDSCNLECLNEFTYAFSHYLPAEEVAAVFIEPIAGDAGLIVPPKKYIKALHKLCRDNGILLVSDEIQQGLGRTGKWFGIENFDVEPDIIVMGKSVGAGLPLGVTIGSTEIMNCMEAPGHVFSLSGNATVCMASLKMLEIHERHKLNEKATENGNYLMEKLMELKDAYEIIGDVRGIGMSIAMDLVKDRKTMKKNSDAAAKVSYRSIEKGLVLITIGQSVLRIQPPLVITRGEIDRGVRIIKESIEEYLNGEIGEEVFENTNSW